MNQDLASQLKNSTRLPSPPGVALKVLELARSEDTNLEDMARVIGSDPALAGKLLKFVNSPMSGLSRATSTLDDAVNHIGLRGVQLMALSFSLVATGRESGTNSFDLDSFWSKCIASAAAGKVLAKTVGRIDPNEAFITGLLYRIGQLALVSTLPNEYDALLLQAQLTQQPIESIEKQIWGVDHVAVSAWLLEQWRLPDTIWKAIGDAPQSSTPAEGERMTLARLMQIADAAASLLSPSALERRRRVDEVLELARTDLGLSAEEWPTLFDEITTAWKAYGQLLSVKLGPNLSFRELQDEAREAITQLSVATQLENMGMREQNQQLHEQSRRDSLTLLPNRSALDERLAGELERARRTNRPLVAIMVDVDHFKRVNDTLGHAAGDLVLKQVAQTLQSTIRKMDFAARYGGEEFVVLAPECCAQNALVLAERLRHAVASCAILFHQQPVSVTISLGVAFAQWPHASRTPEQLLQEADMLLYEAKHAGRNCCRFQPPSRAAA